MFSILEICDRAGMEAQTLRNWIASGLVQPDKRDGLGRGGAHQFSTMKSVGLIVAQNVRASEQSCLPVYFGKVVEAFAAVDEKWLLKEFKQGRVYFVLAHHGRPILSDDAFGRPNVKAAFEQTRICPAKGN